MSDDSIVFVDPTKCLVDGDFHVIFEFPIRYWSEVEEFRILNDKKVGTNLRRIAKKVLENIEIVDDTDSCTLVCSFEHSGVPYRLICNFKDEDRYNESKMIMQVEDYIYRSEYQQYKYVDEGDLTPEMNRYVEQQNVDLNTILLVPL